MRRILGRTLASHGFDVLEAGNGQEALDCISVNGMPDLALVDWNMPVMDGLEFVTTLRSRPSGRSVTLMMVTTESEYSQIVRALAAGAHEYLLKPFTPDALTDKLVILGMIAVDPLQAQNEWEQS